ncbi:MAG: hypothetical protein MR376_06765 [Campylobacter lanienae]|uniref:hypothetical protein n=1 Tax=Campylobacter lanienae TaxID=75658 RepID=UPI00242A775C|nr:hypothetical protein [Campylobacter lanienae]MCI5540250.1 hypothetical protein [Campylobacter lanienae]
MQFSAYNYENGNATIFYKILENDSFESLEEYSDYIYRNYGRKGYPRWNIWGWIFKRDIYLKAFEILDVKCRITMTEDALMSFVLWNLSNKFRHISDILYYYRNNPDSSTKTTNKEIIARNSKDRIFVIKKIKEISKKHKFDRRITKVFIRHLWLCEIYDRMLHNKIGKIILDIRRYVKSKMSKS